ncbi:hypothetical protein VP150E351_P0141 [Vibrio phage 150E35-1]|nr:hypothetical protein VP150E351_P0141 [Vibrio phage 150E35-1]
MKWNDGLALSTQLNTTEQLRNTGKYTYDR